MGFQARRSPPTPLPPVSGGVPYVSVALMMTAVLAWPADTALSRPNNQQQQIAPLTLQTGDQPVPRAPLSAQTLQDLAGRWILTWDTQTAPKTAASIPKAVPRTILPAALWDAWQPPWVQPPKPVSIAPLTLTYGTPPNPQAPLSAIELSQLVSTWVQSWDAQTASKNAAWNVPPILVSLPYTPLPKAIWQAWEPPWIQPPAPVAIVPLTLTYGSQPAPHGPLAIPTLTPLLASWVQSWDAQTGPKNASWNVPPVLVVLPSVPLPKALWAAWEPPWRDPQRLIQIAPLTLVYGQAPPQRPPLTVPNRLVIGTWPADLEPRLLWPNVPKIQIAPLTLTYGTPPSPGPPIRPGVWGALRIWHPPEQWAAQSDKPSIVFTIPPGVVLLAGPEEFFVVGAEGRWFVVDAVGRWCAVPPRTRFSVPGSDRVFIVDAQGRLFEADE